MTTLLNFLHTGRALATVSGERHIQGWKEIASRLGRDERTAKRWEKQRGLPVRRIPGGGRANVYLVESELEAWFGRSRESSSTRPEDLQPAAGGSLSEAPSTLTRAAVAEDEPAAVQNVPAPASPGSSGRPRWLSATIAAACLMLVLVGALYARRSGDAVPGPASEAAAHPGRSSSPEVDQLYLQAVYLSEARTPASLHNARELFQQVIQGDPRFAPAYSGLAVTYLLLREYATMPSDEAYTLAWDAAERAVALDPGLAEPHAALGFIDFFSLWRADDAAREFETAIRLDPRNSTARHWYGSVLMHEGRFSEALQQLDEAQHLNPTSSAILSTKALTLGYGGRRAEAVRLLEALIRSDPSAPGPHRNLAYVSMVEPHDAALYVRELQQFAAMQQDTKLLANLRAAESARQHGGETAMWSALLQQQRTNPPAGQHFTMLTVEAEGALGQHDAALDHLELLAQKRDSNVIGLVICPELRPLHGDARFRRIADMLGLQADPTPLAPVAHLPALAERQAPDA